MNYPIFSGEMPAIRFGSNDEDFGGSCNCVVHTHLSDGDNEILIDREANVYQHVVDELIGLKINDRKPWDLVPRIPDGLDETVAREIAYRHADSLIAWAIHGRLIDVELFCVEDDEEAEELVECLFNPPSIMLMIANATQNGHFGVTQKALHEDLDKASNTLRSGKLRIGGGGD